MNDSMASSQDDRLTEREYGPGMGENGVWNQPGAMGIAKTSKRTYTTPNGTIITEVRTYSKWMRNNYHPSLSFTHPSKQTFKQTGCLSRTLCMCLFDLAC